MDLELSFKDITGTKSISLMKVEQIVTEIDQALQLWLLFTT